MTQASSLNIPLFVDLDGTLVRGDTLHHTLARIFVRKIWVSPLLLLALFQGKAGFKAKASALMPIDAQRLPYHRELLDYLVVQKRLGRTLYLATGANARIAQAVADQVKLFSGIIASDDSCNCTGANKLAAIRAFTKNEPFDYAGDSSVDLPIFSAARRSLLVNPSPALLRETEAVAKIERVFTKS